MRKLSLASAIVYNCLVGVFVALCFGINSVLGFAVFAFLVNCAGVAQHFVRITGGEVLFEGLAAEVWISEVKEHFYPDNHFLTSVRDLSSLVDANTINLADAGAEPEVLKNNTIYPIGTVDASDFPLAIPLNTYDTKNSVVRNAVAVELAYDQRSLYVKMHQNALLKKIGIDAAWAYAPTADDATKSNKVMNLGANDSIVDALIDMQAAYGNYDADAADRIVVFTPDHLAQIAKENKVLYKAIMAEPGSVFYGFKVYAYSKLPAYIAATGVKAAFGAAFDPAIHKQATVCFLGNEVMKAMGTMEFFSRLKDPEARGDVFGYQMRFTASSFRNKYLGAIIK